MGDALTQLQDAVDQLATQFIACIRYVNTHHSLQTLSATDVIRQEKKNEGEPSEVEPLPADVFKAGQIELAQDLVVTEQQIESIISLLPGLDNSEKDQEQQMKQLEEELKAAEQERKEAVKEKQAVLEGLEAVIKSVKRP